MSAKLYDLMDEVRDWNLQAGHMKQIPKNLDVWESDADHRELAISLIEEEVQELREAVEAQDEVETADAIADILFTLFGLAAKSGHTELVEDCLDQVIVSNWTKLSGDPVILPGGKIGKPAGYQPPKIEQIVRRGQKVGVIN